MKVSSYKEKLSRADYNISSLLPCLLSETKISQEKKKKSWTAGTHPRDTK